MTVHVFGATSSPACANFALKATADKFESEFGARAAQFIRDDFYVDDGLNSSVDVSEAKVLVENSRGMCGKDGFCLCKFMCNHREVMNGIPVESRAKVIQQLDILHNDLPIERVLGMQ
ncbi:uncharacterized protein LOC135497187 [Lineus longissimus]|uniref:uncharacterized protein LOC135497187 n=1 Tax=Lineus longissimus TaxID=88925 RepID=UPI00315D8108